MLIVETLIEAMVNVVGLVLDVAVAIAEGLVAMLFATVDPKPTYN